MRINGLSIDEAIANKIEESSSILSDIDKTGTKTRLANSAKELPGKKWKDGERAVAVYGLIEGAVIELDTRLISKLKGKLYAENRGLKKNFDVLAKAGITEAEYIDNIKTFIPENEMPGYMHLLEGLKNFGAKKDVFLSTTGASIGAGVFAEYMGAKDYVAQPVRYSEGKIAGIDIVMKTEDQIADLADEMLRRNGKKLEESIVLNDRWGRLMEKGKVSVAVGKYATEEAIKKADVYIKDCSSVTF